MRVNSWEEGNRPVIMTRARRFAPQARRAFVEMLATQDWATYAYVVLDWTGRIAFVDNHGQSQDGPALDTVLPVMYIQTCKSLPALGGTVITEERLHVDDIFGGTVVTADDLASVVLGLKEELIRKEAAVRQEVNR